MKKQERREMAHRFEPFFPISKTLQLCKTLTFAITRKGIYTKGLITWLLVFVYISLKVRISLFDQISAKTILPLFFPHPSPLFKWVGLGRHHGFPSRGFSKKGVQGMGEKFEKFVLFLYKKVQHRIAKRTKPNLHCRQCARA